MQMYNVCVLVYFKNSIRKGVLQHFLNLKILIKVNIILIQEVFNRLINQYKQYKMVVHGPHNLELEKAVS